MSDRDRRVAFLDVMNLAIEASESPYVHWKRMARKKAAEKAAKAAKRVEKVAKKAAKKAAMEVAAEEDAMKKAKAEEDKCCIDPALLALSSSDDGSGSIPDRRDKDARIEKAEGTGRYENIGMEKALEVKTFDNIGMEQTAAVVEEAEDAGGAWTVVSRKKPKKLARKDLDKVLDLHNKQKAGKSRVAKQPQKNVSKGLRPPPTEGMAGWYNGSKPWALYD
jgi:hypothetical protein